MEVDAETGAVLQKWPASEKTDGDRMTAALKRMEDDKKKRKDLFNLKRGELDDQKKRLASDFQKKLEKAKEEGPDDTAIRPFDLD